MNEKMTPCRPYLLRAYFDWLLDNDLTPHLVVNAEIPGVEVPREFVQNGQIVLNIAPSAVGSFHMDLEAVSFNARFSGSARTVFVPISAVLAIYARETGAGSVFEPEAAYEQQLTQAFHESESKSELAVVEGERRDSSPNIEKGEESPADPDSPPPKKGPSLRVIK